MILFGFIGEVAPTPYISKSRLPLCTNYFSFLERSLPMHGWIHLDASTRILVHAGFFAFFVSYVAFAITMNMLLTMFSRCVFRRRV